MKHLSLVAIAIFLSSFVSDSIAQSTDVINNTINCEFKIGEYWYGNASGESGNSEPVIKPDMVIEGIGGGEFCHDWECDPNPVCFEPADFDDYWNWDDQIFDAYYGVWLTGYESDNNDHCTYDSGDDDYETNDATIRDGSDYGRIIDQYVRERPCEWIPAGNNGSSWMFPNGYHYDFTMTFTWRYNHGDYHYDPLNLGYIGNGIKSDINATRFVQTESLSELSYSNSDGQSSPDVWYVFHLAEAREVTISTDNAKTDFDTYITLYDDNQQLIESDDDGGSGNTSVIQIELCPGSYRVRVEGYSTNEGIFELTIEGGSVVAPPSLSVSVTDEDCFGSNDGSLSWSVSDGIQPYTYSVDGSTVATTSLNSLGSGSYDVAVTDACGTTDDESVFIDVADETAPDAVCVAELNVDVSGGPVTITMQDVDNGSTDNCVISSMTLSQEEFTMADLGSNTVTLTIYDPQTNQSQCTTTVIVSSVTGIENRLSDNAVEIYPNPSEGVVNITVDSNELGEKAKIQVIDNLGRTVYTENVTSDQIRLDLTSVSSGVYLIRLELEATTFQQNLILR